MYSLYVVFDWSKDAKVPEGKYELFNVWESDNDKRNRTIINTLKDRMWTIPSLGFHDNWTVRLKDVGSVLP